MTFAKANSLFTTKSVTKEKTEQSLSDFVTQYSQGSVLGNKTTPVPQGNPTAGSGQESFINNSSFGDDLLRNALGSSFVISGDSAATANSREQFTPAASIAAHEISTELPNSSTPGSFHFGGFVENLAIEGLLDQIDPAGISGQRPYHVFDIPVPAAASAETTYNFYIQEYEELLGRSEENETSLLDIYGTVLSLTRIDGNSELNQAALRLANGVSLSEGLQAPRRFSEPSVPGDNIKTFFRRYSTEQLVQNSKYENIIFPANRLTDVNSVFATTREMFPFYAGFDITKAESGEVCENLQSSRFANTMMRNIASTLDAGEVYTRERFVRNTEEGNFDARIKTWDLIDLLDYQDPSFVRKSVVLGDEMELAETFPEEFRQFASTIDRIEFLSNLQNTIQDNAMNFLGINAGKNCYNEVLMYRVAKYRKDDLQTPFQSFFFFNAPDVSTFNFLDSQVKPGTEYFYKVYSYSIVIGSEYKYSRTDDRKDLDEALLGVEVENNVSLKIVENLVQSTQTFIASRPPIYPDVSFRSFIGENKKIQILFQDRSDTLHEMPVSLSAEEVDRMAKLRTAQGAGPSDPVRFSNDDGIKVYEVYRTTVPPESILEFSDRLWRRVTEKEILDKVTADTTYYYMFRCVDNHGNISNPSTTFEVTLIGGVSPFLIVNDYVYPSAEEDMLRDNKQFKRFLRVRPALQQLILKKTPELTSKQTSADIFNAQLGVAPEGALWGKKYKVRISSIETGKKIDFNIDYNYKFEHRDE
jgi:hypothetical protein